MKKPEIKKEWIESCFDNKYLHVYNLNPDHNHAYYNASRRVLDDLPCIKSDEDFKKMYADAVGLVVILNKNGEKKLLLNNEYRYPAGQMLLSIPAGIIDPKDKEEENPYFTAAIRELHEETGIVFKEGDSISVINPFLFSTPGMSDESDAIIKVEVNVDNYDMLTQENAEGTEVFDGFILLDKEEAMRILKQGVDDQGIFYSVYTWIGLASFLLDL